MSATTEQLLYERRESTAFVTFNRPEARNAMTFAMYEALHERCEEVDADDRVRVLVLRGAGGKAFVAGTDISEFAAFEGADDGLAYESKIDRIVGRVESVAKPTIALIDGYAVGGGLAIAAACDLRICTPEAKFAMPIARTLGNCLSMDNYARLVGLIGPARTKELIYTARSFSAAEALGAGLATEIVPGDELETRVLELAERIASFAPLTLWTTKEALRRLRLAALPDGHDLVAACYGSEDFRAGVAAFNERRPPAWSGR